jgi:quercetin dioxygenase-like cupin family protein
MSAIYLRDSNRVFLALVRERVRPMKLTERYRHAFAVIVWSVAVVSQCNQAFAQHGICKPVSERTSEVGCWISAHESVGQLAASQTFWHLDTYPTRAAAEAAKGPSGTVVESLGKVWLFTIENAGWRPSGGERVAEIGPLPVIAGEKYSAQYMEAIFNPGMTAPAHVHSGPEAWYTLAGETCLETPQGKQIGRAGGEPVIVPGGPPMHLTATGTEQRRALVLILHDSSKPATTSIHDWTPKGLCKN